MSSEAHPIVCCAQAVIHKGSDGRFELSAHGAALLEVTIVDHPKDEGLRDAILTLLGLAVVLHDELDSVEAARMLLMVIGRAKPVLEHLGTDAATLALIQADRIGDRARAVLGVDPTASAKLRGTPPPGAVSVRSLPIERPRPRKPMMPGEAPAARSALPSSRPHLTVVPQMAAKPAGRR